MREILGRRRMTRWALRNAALVCATRWGWPVLPGVAPRESKRLTARLTARQSGQPRGRCSCPRPDCAVPGAHPFDPGLLAATTDARMVRWWWTNRPHAPVLLATGGRAPCALSLPAAAGARALEEFDRLGLRTGPVIATPTRFALLVAPYDLEELGELLYAQDWVPSSLRFHGEGGYVPLPPSRTGAGQVRWEREPAELGGTPWLPRMEPLVDVLVRASAEVPDTGSRLAY
ncbi:MAG TPA: bifunctional DNA primase/polymerase [Streptomyces sp.]|uniref:bifunctional DNA primase/polymerase n=1 Tax=Streptomyces sp. TaxID=1931 RepID=UPI002D5F100D|nr:bifunctional DNA primase/polymerase [Streptomyces sp.]HZG04647.1 bifunctional DNA primase/polymerase [Streptomyces sp.]